MFREIPIDINSSSTTPQRGNLLLKPSNIIFNLERLQFHVTKKMDLRVAILTEGQLFGERDVVLNLNSNTNVFYSTSVRCASVTGEVYAVKKEDFLSKIKFNRDSWNIFINNAIEREKDIRK